jgi:hypothetical protein
MLQEPLLLSPRTVFSTVTSLQDMTQQHGCSCAIHNKQKGPQDGRPRPQYSPARDDVDMVHGA